MALLQIYLIKIKIYAHAKTMNEYLNQLYLKWSWLINNPVPFSLMVKQL